MPETSIPDLGRKRPQVYKALGLLHVDRMNPRLPEVSQSMTESETLGLLYRDFYLDELALSMAKNGYFDEEPLVGIPTQLPQDLGAAEPTSAEFRRFVEADSTELVIVEGNRRLAAAKLLLDDGLRARLKVRHWPKVSSEVRKDLETLPVIVYKNREEVTAYLGVRHIVGIQKWGSYAKARYITKMMQSGVSLEAAKEQVGGDEQGQILKNYICHQLLEQARNDFDFDSTRAKDDFSLLVLAIGGANIKGFLGLPRKLSDANLREPVSADKRTNLQDLLQWIFGDGKKKPVITESRDITNYENMLLLVEK